MQNETIDKLKNAGFITSTADSQGIADKVGISGGDAPNLYFYVDTSDTEHVIVVEVSDGRVMINIMDREGDYLSELFNEFNKNVENNIYPKIVITTDVLPRAINQFELYSVQGVEDGMEGVMYEFISPNMGIIDSASEVEPYTFNYMVLYYAKDDEFDGYVMVLDNESFGSDKNYLEVPEGTELTTDADYIAGYDNNWIPDTGANTKIPTCDIINRAFIYTNNDITKSELESQNGRHIDEIDLLKICNSLFIKFVATSDIKSLNFMRVPYIPSELETVLDTYKPDPQETPGGGVIEYQTYAAYAATTYSKKYIVIYESKYDGESTFRIKLITIS